MKLNICNSLRTRKEKIEYDPFFSEVSVFSNMAFQVNHAAF